MCVCVCVFVFVYQCHSLETKGTHSLTLFLEEGLVELVDNGDGQEDSGTGSDRSHKVGNDRECSYAHTTKGGGRRDVTVQDVDEGRVAVSLHDHLVVTELLGNITGGSARHFDPSLGEQGTGREDKDQVKDGVEGIVDDLSKGRRRGDVVRDSSNGHHLTSRSLDILPRSEKTNEDVGRGAVVQELRHKVQVRHEGRLQDDGHVGRVEQLDGVVTLLSAVLLVLDGQVDTPSLEVDDNDKDEDGGHQVGQVGQVLPVEGLADGADLVLAGNEQMEKSNDGSLELGSTSGVDSRGTEGLPDNVLADVGGDEQTDAGTQPVALL